MRLQDRLGAVSHPRLRTSALARRSVSLLLNARILTTLCFAAVAVPVWVPSFTGRTGESSRRPRFADVAPRSRIPYVTNNNYTGRKYFQQSMCGGVAAFDYDDDGRMDIYFTNGARYPELKKEDASYYNCLLRNQGDGTFKDVTEEAGLTGSPLGFCYGVAAGDFDNDGRT